MNIKLLKIIMLPDGRLRTGRDRLRITCDLERIFFPSCKVIIPKNGKTSIWIGSQLQRKFFLNSVFKLKLPADFDHYCGGLGFRLRTTCDLERIFFPSCKVIIPKNGKTSIWIGSQLQHKFFLYFSV